VNCYFCCQYLSDESYTRTCEVFTEELTNRGELGDVQLHSSNGVDGVCYPGTTLHWTVLHTNAHTHTHTHKLTSHPCPLPSCTVKPLSKSHHFLYCPVCQQLQILASILRHVYMRSSSLPIMAVLGHVGLSDHCMSIDPQFANVPGSIDALNLSHSITLNCVGLSMMA
jgi:hypothetical protein